MEVKKFKLHENNTNWDLLKNDMIVMFEGWLKNEGLPHMRIDDMFNLENLTDEQQEFINVFLPMFKITEKLDHKYTTTSYLEYMKIKKHADKYNL